MAASLSGLFNVQEFTDNGNPASAYRLYTYAPSTTTFKAVYIDEAGTIPHTYTSDGVGGQYIGLDARGELPGPMYLASGGYTIVLKRADGSTVWARQAQGFADLVAPFSTTAGAGLIGYDSGTTYGSGTVGSRLDRTGHPTGTNTVLGFGALPDSLLVGTAGYRTVALGVQALKSIAGATTAGGSNVGIGFSAGSANIDGSGNVYIGALCATANVIGDHNNIVGYRSFDKHTNSLQNNSLGFECAYNLTAGVNNCLFGESVLFTATNVTGAALYGAFAGYSRQTGDYPVAFGYQAGFSETTATGNTLIGKRAGFCFTTQGNNTLVGFEAGDGVIGGVGNTALGYQAMKGINGGTYNSAFGFWAGLRITSGSSNLLFGQQAGQYITTGSDNVLLGPNSGSAIDAGTSNNVYAGSVTGQNMNGNNNVAVGYNAGSVAAPQTYINTICIGSNSIPNASNQVVLGDPSITAIRAQVTTITALSDERDKRDIGTLEVPDEFLDEVLSPSVYRWAMRDGTQRGDGLEVGVIAQKLKASQDKYGLQWLGLVNESDPFRLEATPGKLLYLVCLRAQRQQAAMSSLLARVLALEAAL